MVKQDGVTAITADIYGIVPGTEERRVLHQMLAEGDPTNGLPDSFRAE